MQPPAVRFAAVALTLGISFAACSGGAPASPAGNQGSPGSSSLTVPQGFHLSTFASGLADPRYMAFAPNGDLIVSEPDAGQVVALAGAMASPHVIVSSLSIPHGLAFIGSTLYVAHWDGVSSLAYPGGTLQSVATGFPENGDHNRRALAAGPDGNLYVSIGSSCNICNDGPPLASVQKVAAGGGVTPLATGLRNASGLAFDQSGRLWATVNQRDNIGPTQSVTDNLPPDELDLVGNGNNFGWPSCYPDPTAPKRDPNPEYPGADCSSDIPAALNFQAHSAPLGIAFYNATQFPAAYRGGAFVAFHGSWNRSSPTGDKVVFVTFSAGRPTGYQDFMTGWLVNGRYTGRPAGIAVGPDGALYVSDDADGLIYRVTYGQ